MIKYVCVCVISRGDNDCSAAHLPSTQHTCQDFGMANTIIELVASHKPVIRRPLYVRFIFRLYLRVSDMDFSRAILEGYVEFTKANFLRAYHKMHYS